MEGHLVIAGTIAETVHELASKYTAPASEKVDELAVRFTRASRNRQPPSGIPTCFLTIWS